VGTYRPRPSMHRRAPRSCRPRHSSVTGRAVEHCDSSDRDSASSSISARRVRLPLSVDHGAHFITRVLSAYPAHGQRAGTDSLRAEVDPPAPPWPIPTDRAVHRRRSSGSGRSARRRRRRPSSRPRRTRKTNPPSPTEASSRRPRRRSRPVLSPAPPQGPAPRGRARGISSRRSRRDDPPRGPRRADAGRRRSQRRNLPRKTSRAKHSSPAVGGTNSAAQRILLTTTRSGRKTRDRARRHGARARCACPTNGASSTRAAASGDQGQHHPLRRMCLHPRLLGSTTTTSRRLGHTTNRGRRPHVMPPSTSNHPKPHRPQASPPHHAAASRTRRGVNQ